MTWARMWEATVAEGHTEAAEEFARRRAAEADEDEGCEGAEAYISYATTSEDTVDRIVLLTRWREQSEAHDFDERAPFGRMFARTHAWVFQQL